MDLTKIASRVALDAPGNMLKPGTEYSCHTEVSISVDFEGEVSKSDLVKKIKSEIIAAIKTGMEQVAKDLKIRGTGIVVSPLQLEVAINDQADFDDAIDFQPDDADFAEPDFESLTK